MSIIKPKLGITIGDLNGIGIETILKVFSDNRILDTCTPIIYGHVKILNYYKKQIEDCNITFNTITSYDKINFKQINVFQSWEEDVFVKPGILNDEGGKYAVASLIAATEALKNGDIDGIVTSPIHKTNVMANGFPYTGHTPYFKEQFGAKDVVMMLYSGTFKVGLLTEHVPLKDVNQYVTFDHILSKLNIINQSLIKDFGIEKPKIAVLGLNPHAGDDGLIGTEEMDIIKPSLEKIRDEHGIMAFGPYSADGYFAHGHYNNFDATLAMYHDQGLIPLKSLGLSEGINYTCGLPIVRTSPDHGTAFDIAGKGIANPNSLREAVYEAVDIIRNRKSYEFYTANPLERQKLSKEK